MENRIADSTSADVIKPTENTFRLHSARLTCTADESFINDIDMLDLVLYMKEIDEWSVKELEKRSTHIWVLEGTLHYWKPGVDVVQLTAIDMDKEVSLGVIDINRSLLEEASRMNDTHELSFQMRNEHGENTMLYISFTFDFEEESDEELEDLATLQNELLAVSREPQNAFYLHDKGKELMKYYVHSNKSDKDLIDLAIEYYRAAAACLPTEDSRYPNFQHDIYLGLLDREEQLGDIRDLNECINIMESLIDTTTDDDPMRETWIMKLGGCLVRRFDKLGHAEDQERAVSLLPPTHPDKAMAYYTLSKTFLQRYNSDGDIKYLEKSISTLDEGLTYPIDKASSHSQILTTLGTVLRMRFELYFSATDIERGIEVQRTALSVLPDGHNDIPGCLANLGNSLLIRYEHQRNIEYLEESIEIQRKVLRLTPSNNPIFHRRANNLATALMQRFRHTSSLPDIEESVRLHREAINVEENVAEKWKWMQNLSSALFCRFMDLGDLSDIEEAISVQQKAMLLIQENDPALPDAYSYLGMLFLIRFDRTEDKNDIDEAILAIREAINLTPDSHPNIFMRWNQLSMCLTSRFNNQTKTIKVDDIEEAVEVYKKLLGATTPETSSFYSQFLSNFGTSLLARFRALHTVEDVIEAISLSEKAIELTQADDPFLPGRLINFANLLIEHSENSDNDSKSIERAIEAYKKALYLTPENHIKHAKYLSILGDAYRSLYHATGNIDHLNYAIHVYRKSTMNVSGLPATKLQSGRQWANICEAGGEYKEAFEAYSACFNILPEVATLGEPIHSRHTHLKPLSAFATEAAAVAIELENYSAAVEWLEQGRSVVWNQLNNLRSPFDELRDVHPSLAQQLLTVSDRLQRAGSRDPVQSPFKDFTQKISIQEEVIERQKLSQEWDKLVSEARQLPGFEHFLQPRKFKDIVNNLPMDGTVIILNVSELRSDAIVLHHGVANPTVVNLEGVNVQNCEQMQADLDKILASHGLLVRDARAGRIARFKSSFNDFEKMLGKLWHLIAKPIFDNLQITAQSGLLQRLWWCTTGAMSFLPIHAAGIYIHRDGMDLTPQTVPDLAISSYTPTLSALFKGEKQSNEHGFEGFLAISQPNTPGLPPILKTVEETETVVSLFNSHNFSNTLLTGEEATCDKVLQEMGNNSWVHFACHALQDDVDPTKSAIFLHDRPLRISDIIKKLLPRAEFAFLSACQTATGDRELSEEAVHLAAGMLAAGYPSVIASMWSISDQYAPMVSKEVYSYILRKTDGGKCPDRTLSAEALHVAIKKLRGQPSVVDNIDDMSFLVWVPFIHIGL